MVASTGGDDAHAHLSLSYRVVFLLRTRHGPALPIAFCHAGRWGAGCRLREAMDTRNFRNFGLLCVWFFTMIAHLKGRLESTGIDHAVIDVGGVGYLVGASARRSLPVPSGFSGPGM